jgi:uncharacterized lipoprotein YmbA
MKILRLVCLCIFACGLLDCSRSPEVNFYVLNPIPEQIKSNRYANIRIGINEINLPAYMYKSQFIIHRSAHQVKLNEHDQWAGPIDKNVQRVVRTNLSTLLPGTVISNFPWDNQFKPNHQLHIDITQFEVDSQGNSMLRAEYLIYSGENIERKRTVYFHQKIEKVTVEALVISMNANLDRLTQDISMQFIAVVGRAR